MIFIGLIAPVLCITKGIEFKQSCSGYLKQAADANTVELALNRIDLALAYIEKKGLTEGYTSVLWRTEDENIGYWYENIKACQSELLECINGTQLEKSNVLMKVRESLTDNGEKGTELTIPDGIHKYPDNGKWALANTICLFFLFLGICFIGSEYD